MEPLLAEYREKERFSSDSSIDTDPTPSPTNRSNALPKFPAAFLETESKPTRARSASPSKRKIDEVVEVSRPKRSRLDPMDSCLGPLAETPWPPSPTYTALQSGDGDGDDDDVACGHSPDIGSVHDHDCEDPTDPDMGLIILEKTTETLKTLLASWKEANSLATELTKCSETMGHVLEQVLSRTAKNSGSKVTAYKTPELPKTQALTLRSKEIADELVHRTKNNYEYVEGLNPNLETKHCVTLYYLMKLTEGLNALPRDVAPIIWFLLPTLRKERENAYHALTAHPYIAHKTSSSPNAMQRDLKQLVIDFFDRCFTYQVATACRLQVRLTGSLLRLGGDSVFKSSDGLNAGGEDYGELDNHNQKVWQNLLIRSAELSAHIRGEQTSPKRTRGETSSSSLGLTRLFLGDEEDMAYEGDDEATVGMKPTPRDKGYRKDSGIEINCLPSKIDSGGEPCEVFCDPCEEPI